MRVIAGIYRGRVLKSPYGGRTRPTSDRLRETLFNILTPRIDDETRFLDLCAGTGAIGIEALSRGIAFATFVDVSKKACALIEENLDKLGVPESQTEVLNLTAENFTSRAHEVPWDIAFFDPPYESDYGLVLYEFGTKADLLRAGGVLVVEHHTKHPIPDAVAGLRRWRLLKQGDTGLSFFEHA